MKIEVLGTRSYGSMKLKFYSENELISHEIETFCMQVPSQMSSLNPNKHFQIPDEFMMKELGIKEDPVLWYKRREKELGRVASQVGHPDNIFDLFFNAIGNFFHYNREKKMENWEERSLDAWGSLAWNPDD